ncbi:MAG: hypothetical protein MUE90_11405 [Thermoanaerobaculales bacterium]|nr:hypothetical protein [Thermoanaerobaculales bacterium]
MIVPVIVHAEGVGGTVWRSDVVVANRGWQAQRLRFSYVNPDKVEFAATRTLPAFATLMLEDLVANLFGAGSGRGPLSVEVLTEGTQPPAVVARAYAESSSGSLGSGLSADVQPAAAAVSMPGLVHDGELRTNIAVTAGEVDVVATFELFRGLEGKVAGGVQRSIAARSQDQWTLAQLFPGKALAGVAMTVRTTLTKPAIVLASLVDNASTDSVLYLGGRPEISWLVPVVARAPGAGGTFWSSSVSLWNSTGSTAWVDLEYLPEATDNSGGGILAAPLRLEPNATLVLDDVLRNWFATDSGKGALAIEATQPITVTSRVFTAGPRGGSSGNGVRAVPASSLHAGDRVLPGVRTTGGFRTSVGLVSGGRGVSFVVELRGADGSLLASRAVDVPPRSLRQWTVQQLFGSAFRAPEPAGSLLVSADGPFLAYLTVIDGSSQDPVFVMPQ